MRLKKYIIGVCIASTTLAACEVDRFPYNSEATDQINPEDVDYVKNSVNGIYAWMKGSGSESWINNAHRITEYNSDNVALSGTTTDDLFYIYNYKHVDNGGRNNDFWVRSYRIIYSANLVIDNAAEGRSNADDHLLGEAYFLRAMMHFYLVNVYGRPYTQGAENLGIPIKIKSDPSDWPARATVGNVYTQVLEDLNKAITLMTPEEATDGKIKESYYATIGGVKGLLSRVYLYMGNNEKALEYADEVIRMPQYQLLSPAQFRLMNTLVPEKNTESIFAIRYFSDLDEGDQYNNVGSFYASIDDKGWGEMFASRSYLDLVDYFPNDARQAFFQSVYASEETEGLWIRHEKQNDGFLKPVYKSGIIAEKDGKSILKEVKEKKDGQYIYTGYEVEVKERQTLAGAQQFYFEGNGGADTIVYKDKELAKRNNYPKYYILKCSKQDNKIHSWSPIIVRMAEMYLNKAEALQKLGRPGDAIIALNALREQRGVPAYDGSAVSGRGRTDLLDVILDERRLELAYEGHRAFDIFRNNKVLDRNYPGTHALNKDSDVAILPTSNSVVQLIPRRQMTSQDNLVQNPL